MAARWSVLGIARWMPARIADSKSALGLLSHASIGTREIVTRDGGSLASAAWRASASSMVATPSDVAPFASAVLATSAAP